MFDLAWSHLLLIGVVALLVIGPKDLPRALRTLGVWVGRARAIAREFQNNLDQMIREAELEEVRKQVESAATLDINQTIEKAVDPGGELKRTFATSPIPEVAPPESIPEPIPEVAPPESTPEAGAKPAPEALPPAPEAQPAESPAAKSGTRD